MTTGRVSSQSELVQVSRALCRRVDRLAFASPVAFVYSPLGYARALREQYLVRYGGGPKAVLLLGMNPGPFGMAQTGVPFGDVASVKEFLDLDADVERPKLEHPKRPVQGLGCPRQEISGARLWGWAREEFGTAERFFAGFFVANYCPLAFMEESGKNLTPDKLPVAEQGPLFAACDEALRRTVLLLRPRHVVGVGAFASERARQALAGSTVTIGTILHPSPANPLANRGWAAHIRRQLVAMGVAIPSARTVDPTRK